ncbi:hypothetical protein COT97_04165 [Candidatus Falkowbacteria bacterium CG10_big_fil_rev_8_21_14_0_10_39_11]|uniref:Uncharacterized protein n=1 Tax=Candidatus Falkowbacteria bacterium CG10_big_fil_rev_8_21_14_0_10_39_11 TaxID=1974565 RepID=A0A2H0V492_9BACT|nr:MAG: hypothetical protein COT97_04165 [Candidatus Falkowbacteria bacterium CG10_big_fil_rev_8_21_14_0_10_39_11]
MESSIEFELSKNPIKERVDELRQKMIAKLLEMNEKVEKAKKFGAELLSRNLPDGHNDIVKFNQMMDQIKAEQDAYNVLAAQMWNLNIEASGN